MPLTEEQKRYRNDFIMLTLFAAFGIMIGIFLYEYTGFFDALGKESLSHNSTEYSLYSVISLFYDEIKLLILLFLCGFTLFSPIISAISVMYKGFLCGFSVLYFAIEHQSQSITQREFKLLVIIHIITLILYILTGASSMAFSGTLKYTSPDMPSLLKQDFAKRYIITFLIITLLIVLISVLKSVVPFIK